jgi:integrase/recombinase XerD
MRVQEILTSSGQKRYLVIDEHGNLIPPVARYLKYLDSIGRARNTLRTYAFGLRLFFEYLFQEHLDYQQITLDELGGFILWLKNPYPSANIIPQQPIPQARTNETINQTLSAVSGFYDYLWRQEECETRFDEKTAVPFPARYTPYKRFLHHLASEPVATKHLLKQPIPRRKPKTLPKETIAVLVNACHQLRDKLLLTLLYESSIRIGEALALWIEDVDIGRCQLHIRDRGPLVNAAEIKTPASCRTVDVSRDLINQILDYVALAHTDEIETNHLFIKVQGPGRGEPLAYADVADLFRRLKRKTGIDATAHLLRHSSLTHLARAGWRPELLRERAGHAQFQYTYQLYVHVSDEDLRQEWERTESQMHVDPSLRKE